MHNARTIGLLSALILLLHHAVFPQWAQTAGPEGGHISAIISHNGFVFAGTNGAGNMRSSDGGTTWTEVNSGYGYPFTTSYLVKGTTLYSATVNVYRTTDDGNTWTGGTGLPNGNSVTSLATDGALIYAGISAGVSTLGVYRSSDNGVTWLGSTTGLPDYAAIISLCVSGSTVFAAASGSVPGIYRSTDQGITWGLSGTGFSGIYPGVLLESGGIVYAATSNSGVYRSTDNGDTWQQFSNGLPSGVSVYSLQEHAGAVYAATLVYPVPAGVYKTTDSGATWVDVTNNFPPNQGTFALGSHGSVLLAGVYGRGIVRSTDAGATWARSNTSLINSRVTGFATRAGNLLAVVQNDGVYRSPDNGVNWMLKNNGTADYLGFGGIASDASRVVVLADRGQFVLRALRSTDDGTTWTEGTNLPFYTLPQQAVIKDNLLFVAASSSGVYLSTDFGDSWTAANNGIPFTTIDDIEVHGGDLFAAGSEVYRSTDNGASWTLANTGIPSFAGIIRLTSMESSLFAISAYNANVYRTTDMGASWTIASQLPGPGGTDLIAHGANLFAGVVNAGVHLSTNGGTTWTNIGSGLPASVFSSVAVSGTDLFCGTDVRGVWTRPLSEVTAVEFSTTGIPERTSLAQNYPNPFNPKTEIGLRITDYGFVSLRIFDLVGREVATLVNENLHAGEYSVPWDAAGLPGGVYFYQMRTGSVVETRKMILLR